MGDELETEVRHAGRMPVHHWLEACPPGTQKRLPMQPLCFLRNGRGERIRTSDLTVPNRALYQAEPRPDLTIGMITRQTEQRAKSEGQRARSKLSVSSEAASAIVLATYSLPLALCSLRLPLALCAYPFALCPSPFALCEWRTCRQIHHVAASTIKIPMTKSNR
jgi:hypothetical protein